MKHFITPLIIFFSFQIATTQSSKTGNFVANLPSIYPIVGTVTMSENNGELTITFEDDFATVQGIRLEVFLSVTGDLDTNNDIKISSAPLDDGTSMNTPITGSRSFTAPAGTGINDFAYVVVYCTSANVLWGGALMGDSNTNEGSWTVVDAGFGTKPSIALTSDGYPRIAYMSEVVGGFIKLSLSNDTTFTTELVDSGYFYGPLDIAVGANDLSQIVYHDHTTNGGDLVIATQNGEFDWDQEAVISEGHDGWDATIYIDDNGESHLLGVHDNGDLEYSVRVDGQWVTEGVGLTSLNYRYATDIIVDNNVVHMACVRNISNELFYVRRQNGSYTHQVVDTVSLFPSMDLDDDGTLRMAYYKRGDNPTSGQVIVATLQNGEWIPEVVDQLTGVDISFGGARNIVDLERNNGDLYVSYGNKEIVKLANNRSGNWSSETVIDYTGRPVLGQQTSLEFDQNGKAHITTFRKQASADGGGVVMYATNKAIVVEEPDPDPDPITGDTTLLTSFQVLDPEWNPIPMSEIVMSTTDDSTTIVRNGMNFEVSGNTNRDVNLEVCITNRLPAATGVSSTDLVKALRIALDEVEPCAQNLVAADVNESGNVSVTDLVQMLNVIIGKSDSFSGNPSYIFSLGGNDGKCHTIKFSELISAYTIVGIKKGDLPCVDTPK